ncbi:uncharacterized protein LOC121197948 isoform X2 [Toxotes jaculatrix]|uniref:uncharacterized protein LOC121197948 isoform X2 n=1 Tax=Toxotes jaculatrix TaxID=941984 RepID=UPI001B3A98A2|nr:uncharacterized protein LOC121197948 isoform X2 [Toxotes jaculatrix]
MSLLMYVLGTLIMPIFVSTIEYLERNISCNDIKGPSGFAFPLFRCSFGDEIYAHREEIVIGSFWPGNLFHLDEVIRMDSSSVVTKQCIDLKVQCIGKYANVVNETWLIFKTIEQTKDPDPDLSTPWGLIIGVVILLGLIIIGVLMWCYTSWKKEMKKERKAATVSGFFSYLMNRCGLRKGISQAGVAGQIRYQGGDEVLEYPASDLVNQEGYISLAMPSIANPHEDGENNTEHDGILRTVHANGTDPETPYARVQDHYLSNGGIQATKNGDISAPDVNKASCQRAINRNLMGDPGGVNHNKGKDTVIANPGSNMTGEAAALVNKHDFDPDQVSRCCAAPDTDVESTPKIKT